MKIRIYSPFFPYPPTDGSLQVVYNQAAYLANHFDVELVVWKTSHADIAKKVQLPRVIPFDSRIRAFSLEVQTEKEGLWTQASRVAKSLLSPEPSPALFHYPKASLVERKLNGLEPADLGIYHYSYSALWLREPKLRKEKKNVCMMHNLEADFFALRAHASQNPLARWIHHQNSEKLRTLEAGLLRLFDELWFLSELDRIDFIHRYKVGDDKKLRLVPPIFDPKYFIEVRKRPRPQRTLEDGPVLGILGAMNFAPHEMGLRWLIKEVFPRLVKESFSGRILVGGRFARSGILQDLESFPFVQHVGYVENVEDFYAQLDGILVPHLAGSGVRIKLLEALAAGVPVLCHPGALTPLPQEIREHAAIAHSSSGAEWAEIINQQEKWRSLRQALPTMPKSMTGESAYAFLGPSSIQ